MRRVGVVFGMGGNFNVVTVTRRYIETAHSLIIHLESLVIDMIDAHGQDWRHKLMGINDFTRIAIDWMGLRYIWMVWIPKKSLYEILRDT